MGYTVEEGEKYRPDDSVQGGKNEASGLFIPRVPKTRAAT